MECYGLLVNIIILTGQNMVPKPAHEVEKTRQHKQRRSRRTQILDSFKSATRKTRTFAKHRQALTSNTY